MAESKLPKNLINDPDGLLTYEYLANNIEDLGDQLTDVTENMINVDATGQFIVSAARYLHAINPELYSAEIDRLIAAAIDKDRERNYISSLLSDIWGSDYSEHVNELKAADNNFRRIYKRLYPESII